MTGQYLCTTVLEFQDRYEGNVLHVGDHESCEKIAELVPAVCVSGDDPPIESRILVVPLEEMGELGAGAVWRCSKEGSDS